MSDQSQPSPKAKLRWYQFSLRTLLIIVTLFAIPCSWLAVKMKQASMQKETVEAVIKLGGVVEYDDGTNSLDSQKGATVQGPAWLRKIFGDDFFRTVTYVGFDDPKVTDTDIKLLEGLQQLRRVSFWGTSVTVGGLKQLEGFKSLEDLDLSCTRITDADLEALNRLQQLKDLDLGGTAITDFGLEHLKGLNQLQGLKIYGTKITDAGLKYLKVLEHLTFLNLESTKITDVGLKHLEGLKQLKTLLLSNSQVTDAGIEKLQKALPNCEIVLYHDTL